jgi:hypothetical protein
MTIGQPVGCQRAVYAELLECARDYFFGDWHDLPIKVRINPLLVGSTGSGKTFLINRLAADLGLPVFTATAGDWILLCAHMRGAPPTLPLLYQFIERHSQAIIFLDEIEKLGRWDNETSDWGRCCQLEIFSILDRKVIPGVLEESSGPRFSLSAEQLAERLEHSTFIVSAGAWQQLWETKRNPVGFKDLGDTIEVPSHAKLAASLRLEILNRISGTPLMLPPLSANDYHSVFEEIFRGLPANIRKIVQQPTEAQIQEAVRSNKGFRFFEELLAVAVRSRRQGQPSTGPRPDEMPILEDHDRRVSAEL